MAGRYAKSGNRDKIEGRQIDQIFGLNRKENPQSYAARGEAGWQHYLRECEEGAEIDENQLLIKAASVA